MTRVIPIKLESDVQCGTCFACCVQDKIILGEHDDLSLYKWHYEGGMKFLDRKANGECIYLNKGCGIYNHRPRSCHKFDCREFFLNTPKAERRQLAASNPSLKQVFLRGKKLLSVER